MVRPADGDLNGYDSAENRGGCRPGEFSEEDIALGQGLTDIATIGLLQERAVKEQNIISPHNRRPAGVQHRPLCQPRVTTCSRC